MTPKSSDFFSVFLALGALALYSQEASEMRVIDRGKPIAEALMKNEIVNTSGAIYRNVAVLIVKSDVENLGYDANNGMLKIARGETADTLYLTEDERVVQIYRPGYRSLNINLSDYGISLSQIRVWQIEIAGYKIQREISITIKSNPPGANVYIDGLNSGVQENFLTTPGWHQLKLAKEGFLDKVEAIKVSNTQIHFQFELELHITIRTKPQEATIFIDDERVLNATPGVKPGVYKLRIEKSGYIPITKTITVTPAQTLFVFDLERSKVVVERSTAFGNFDLQVVVDAPAPDIGKTHKIGETFYLGASLDLHLKNVTKINQLFLNLFGSIGLGGYEDDDGDFDLLFLPTRGGLGVTQKIYTTDGLAFVLSGAYLRRSTPFDGVFARGLSVGGDVEFPIFKFLDLGIKVMYNSMSYNRAPLTRQGVPATADLNASNFSSVGGLQILF